MTIREHLRRRVIIGYGLVLMGVALFVGSALIGKGDDIFQPLFAIAFVPFFGAVIYLNFGLRCPRCKGNLAMTPAGYPTFSRKYRYNFCPFCGVSADEKL